MPTQPEVTFKDVIDDVRQQLADTGIRIAETPEPFIDAWWWSPKDDMWAIDAELRELRGDSPVPQEIIEGFYAEVKAIEACLNKRAHAPGVAKWQKSKDPAIRRMFTALNQRVIAFSIWEQIAFPIRLRGNVVVRVVAPNDASGFGTPVVEAMPADEFIRGASTQTARDKQELVRLRQSLHRWRLVGGTVSIVALVMIAERILLAMNWLG